MSASAASQRGLVLLQQRRYPEAEKYFREALSNDPNDPGALYFLAVCQTNQNNHKDALDTIDRALSVEPEVADMHALRAFILVDLHRSGDALKASEEALRIDPDSDFALTARAASFLSRNEWATAELAARKALDINPENTVAANQLAHALRLQNRLQESAEQTGYMLSQDPESGDNHSTAGWLALQRGDGRKAEEHFLEALRLDAGNESAKAGLKEAFKSRSAIYRWYLNYCFFMQRFTAGKQWLVILGLLLAVNIAPFFLPRPLALGVTVLYMLFVLWVHVARAVGNFQLLFDRFARHALEKGEMWEAIFVGIGVLLGLPLMAAGLISHQQILLIAGVTLIGSAFPFAYTFMNSIPTGRLLFGGIGVFVYFAGGIVIYETATNTSLGSWTENLGQIAFLAVIGVTWLCGVRTLNRRA
jgi:tetratricopeptide (TPR) repeat protein